MINHFEDINSHGDYLIKKVSTGVRFLDNLLNGGYDADTITTIYGPAGSGKTNLCIVFANYIAKKGKVIYVDTEKGFSLERLSQINPHYKDIINNIIFFTPKTFSEQDKVIALLEESIKKETFDAIIFDSIALLYRLELGKLTNVYEINRSLGIQLQKLSNIAKEKQIPILLTTQVYSDLKEKSKSFRMIGGDLLAYISKTIIELDFLQNKKPNTRILRLVKHRSQPQQEVFFIINERGIFALDKNKKDYKKYFNLSDNY